MVMLHLRVCLGRRVVRSPGRRTSTRVRTVKPDPIRETRPPRSPIEEGRRAAIKLARKQFLASRRIEMGLLAHELGVSRMTLNRWVGSRDLLLGEINWTLARTTLDDCRRRATGTGADAIAFTM